jgi:hypothetical protein
VIADLDRRPLILDRLQKASRDLQQLVIDADQRAHRSGFEFNAAECKRLAAKRAGVDLAISYVEQDLREFPA